MASATTIRSLLVRLGVDADDKAAINFDRAVAGAKRTMIAASAAATALAGGLFALTRRVAHAGDEAAKAAARIGTTAQTVQELAFAADITGASMAELEGAMRRMSRTVRDAEDGSARAAQTIDRLGIETRDANGEFRDQVDIFEDSLKAIDGIESSVERAAVAQDLFGRAGTRVLTMIERQGADMAELRQEARDLGLVMSDEAAAASEEFNDSVTRLLAVLTGIRNQIGLGLMPVFAGVINRTREWLQTNRQIIQQRIDQTIDQITRAIERLAPMAAQVEDLIKRFGGWDTVISTVASALTAMAAIKIAPAIVAALKGIIALFSAAGAVVLAKVAAVVGLVLIIQDLITFLRGGESAIGNFIGRFTDADDVLARVQATLKSVGDAFLSAIIPPMQDVFSVVQDIGGILLDFLMPVVRDIIDVLVSLGSLVASIFGLWFRLATFLFQQLARLGRWWWETALKPVLDAIMPLVRTVLGTVLGFFKLAFDNIRDVVDFFIAIFDGEFDSLGEIAEAALDLVRGIFDRAFGFVVDRVKAHFEALIGFIEPIIEWISDMIDKTIGRITDAVDAVRGVAGAVVEGAQGAAERIPGVGRLFAGDDAAANDAAGQARADSQRSVAMAMSQGDTVIDIDVATGADPAEIADEVARRQENLWQRRLRQTQTAFGAGEV